MIGKRSSKMQAWKDIELLGLLNYPCKMLIYFYNKNFDANQTITKLIRIDKYYISNTMNYALSSLFFIVSNYAYNKSIGFLVSYHDIKKQKLNILRKEFSSDDINNTFQILENTLSETFLLQAYGLEDLQSVCPLFRFDNSNKDAFQWFEEVFTYFLFNRILSQSTNLHLLLKDLDCYYWFLPYRLIEMYYLARIFDQCYYIETTSFVNIFQLLEQVYSFFCLPNNPSLIFLFLFAGIKCKYERNYKAITCSNVKGPLFCS